MQDFKRRTPWVALFAAIYMAILPMANTIALRNVSLLALLVCLAVQFKEIRAQAQPGLFVGLWVAYLLVFPLAASDQSVAWSSLGGQWGRGLLAMVAGAGTALVLAGSVSVFSLGLVSCLPLAVHLVLVTLRVAETGAIPWNYWGRESHHADLGYAAGHVVILMTIAALTGGTRQRLVAIGVVVASLLSLVIAQSRGGLAFAILGGVLVLLMVYRSQASLLTRGAKWIAVVAFGLAMVVAYGVKVDTRWQLMADRLAAGWLGDAIHLQCVGWPAIAEVVESQHGAFPQSSELIDSVRNGDGSRMVLLRAGAALVLKNPWGSDGSRQAFQKVLAKECVNPAIVMAHAHNGWIDTMLAIGILGGALYAGVLLRYAYQGFQAVQATETANPWAIALFCLAVFWFLRGFTDSVYRDHMLEMQGFVLAFALVMSRKPKHAR